MSAKSGVKHIGEYQGEKIFALIFTPTDEANGFVCIICNMDMDIGNSTTVVNHYKKHHELVWAQLVLTGFRPGYIKGKTFQPGWGTGALKEEFGYLDPHEVP